MKELSYVRCPRLLQNPLAVLSLLVLMALVCAPGIAKSEPQKTQYSTVDLLAGQDALPVEGGTATLALMLSPDAGWHAYWKNPGDAGRAPKIKWTLPGGFSAAPFRFPAPHLIPFGEMNTYGYDEPLFLLAEVNVPAGLEPGTEYEITGKASWVVCDDELCVPERATLSLKLPAASSPGASDNADAIAGAEAQVPAPVDWSTTYQIANDSVDIHVAVPAGNVMQDPYLFIESKKLVAYASQTAGFVRDGIVFTMPVSPRVADGESTSAVLTWTDEAGIKRSVELAVTPGTADGAIVGAAGGVSLAGFGKALIFAFLGGIILNAMPCVFPILSMKALSLVSLSHSDRRIARESGILYTLGVLVAFAAIGAALVGVRAAGDAVGWGFQMQSPLVNVALGALMVAIALNLFGVYEVGSRLAGTGQSLTEGSERKVSFFTGLLAVVVATPCTAPFMAGALGYALAQPAAVAIAVFLALGVGLAFPYLLFSLVPRLGRMLPKPGAWTARLRILLGFPMLITALWLFWIVGRQLGVMSMTAALLAAVLLALGLWLYGQSQMLPRRTTWLAATILTIAAAGYTGIQAPALGMRDSAIASNRTLGTLELEHFSPELVRDYVASGQPVFVYFTADWCVSCKVNERVALATDAVGDAFDARGIRVVEGDWTNEDPVITEWLAKYDRVGVPLYLYFPAGSTLESATVLPQVLLPATVVAAIEQADSDTSTRAVVAAVGTQGDDAYVVPDAAPDWSVVGEYVEIDTAWHELDREIQQSDLSDEDKAVRLEQERGEHPDIQPAVAAATAIVNSGPENEKFEEAAWFLIEHTFGFEGAGVNIPRGAYALLEHLPEREDWPQILRRLEFLFLPGTNAEVDRFFAIAREKLTDPVAAATARYYQSARLMRQANDVSTDTVDRMALRDRAIEIAEGLSQGLEDAGFWVPRRPDENGDTKPLPSLADVEADLLYNLRYMSVGSTIPEVLAQNLDGNAENINDYVGRAVLLDFWATWCGPCIGALPKLRELAEDLSSEPFQILSISVDEDADDVIEFQYSQPMPWANWHIGPESEIIAEWAIRGYPTYILIDANGVIAARTQILDEKLINLVKSVAEKS